MKISKQRCVGCANCVPICSVGSIYIGADGLAEIIEDSCVECHNCYRSLSFEHLPPGFTRLIRRALRAVALRFQPDPDICPTEAFIPDELSWPRVVRRAFSDPMVTHESTGVHGRGTEEVKTNDVSKRIKSGQVGLVVELGRPGLGVYFHQVQQATMALAAAGVSFETGNPVTQMMEDRNLGTIRADVLNEKVLSCIVEITARLEQTPQVLSVIREICRTTPTVISIGAATVCDEQGREPLREILAEQGFATGWAKVNLGLGRVSNRSLDAAGRTA